MQNKIESIRKGNLPNTSNPREDNLNCSSCRENIYCIHNLNK